MYESLGERLIAQLMPKPDRLDEHYGRRVKDAPRQEILSYSEQDRHGYFLEMQS